MSQATKKPARKPVKKPETTAEFVERISKPSGKHNGLRRMGAVVRRSR